MAEIYDYDETCPGDLPYDQAEIAESFRSDSIAPTESADDYGRRISENDRTDLRAVSSSHKPIRCECGTADIRRHAFTCPASPWHR